MPHGRAVTLILTPYELQALERLCRPGAPDAALNLRARIVLLATRGLKNVAIAERLGLDTHTVGRWRRRFAADRLGGLQDECRHTPADEVPDRFFG